MNLMVSLFVLTAQFRELAWAVAYGQPSAALWKDQLLVATPSEVYRGTFDPDRRRLRDPVELYHPGYLYSYRSQPRLDIRDDRLLLLREGSAHFIFPMTEVPLLEKNEFGRRLNELLGYKWSGTEHWDHFASGGANLLFPFHRDPDVAAPLLYPNGKMIGIPVAVYTRSARYNVQLGRPGTVRLFHAHKDKLFVSIEPDNVPRTTAEANRQWPPGEDRPPRGALPKPPDRELRTGKLPVDFTEHFAAYTAGKRDYLVTNNGKVYMAVPKGKDGVEVTSVWDDPKRRIVGVVQDPANDSVYGWGFAGTDGSADRFYVKLDPKPVAVPYKLTVPLWNDRSDAYLESYECARAFRKATEKK